MSRATPSEDTAPLIRLLAVFGVATTAVVAIGIVSVTGGGGAGSAGNAGAARGSAPAAPPPSAISELASDLTQPGPTPVTDGTESTPAAPRPRWIWAAGDIGADDAVTFTRTITVPADADQMLLQLSCDNEAIVRVDGVEVARSTDWATPVSLDLTEHTAAGVDAFTLEIEARNHGGTAGMLASVAFHAGDPRRDRILSDAAWRVTAINGALVDQDAFEIAESGDAPWGDVAGFDRTPLDRNLQVPPGFIVELVHDVTAAEGSWVSLAVDGRGRLVASDQSGGLFRITPAPAGAPPTETRVEALAIPVGAAQGLLFVDDDLYCITAASRADGPGPGGDAEETIPAEPRADVPGVYRIRDEDGDDVFDSWERLIELNAGGEHGPHGIVLGPEGRLYLVAGNYTRLPPLDHSLVPPRWDEDHLLPRLWDARGHAVGLLAPGGWICRFDLDGTGVELFASGFRNAYDLAFDRHGELFTYDSDMEWDLGSPWYRPTRIVHAVSGADYGWRSGSGKWATHYRDSLPATRDIGPGSPTGLSFGYDTDFPPRYRDALFALDWTFGTVYAVHLQPDGASYTATHEPFLTGRPLPVADIVANPHDGAMYVVLGGRGIRSAIYRVRAESPAVANAGAAGAAAHPLPPAHDARRALEHLHRPDSSTGDLDRIWPALGDPDRFIAYAARVALEFRPVDAWLDRLRAETDADIRLNAMIALARTGDASAQEEFVTMLAGFPYPDLTAVQRKTWLRAAALGLIRLGPAVPEQAQTLRTLLEPHYPAADDMETRELCAMLVALDSPVVVSRTLTVMERADDASAPPEAWFDRSLLARNDTYGSIILKAAAAMPQQQQIALALSLREATAGWTPQLRRRYFEWFDSAGRASGGLSFSGFLDRIRSDALENVPEDEREALTEPVAAIALAGADRPFAKGPGRQWTIDELAARAPDRLRGRDFANGRDMFTAALCAECHRVAGVGGDSGPDLTAIGTRFTLRDLLESIIEPSRTISSQYEQSEFILDDDTLVTGRVVDLDETALSVQPTPLAPDHLVTLPRERIVSQQPSPVSPMMPRLLDALNEDEVLDLIAYLLAEGDERNAMFTAPR